MQFLLAYGLNYNIPAEKELHESLWVEPSGMDECRQNLSASLQRSMYEGS